MSWPAGLLTAATVVLAMTATGCQRAPVSTRPVEIGMGVHMMFDDAASVGRQFDLLQQMHVSLVRVDFDWSAIEEVRGTLDWSYPDRMVDNASARGMRVLALLTYTPGWARPPGSSSHTPPQRAQDFAAFAAAAAQRYASRGVDTWEIWNEPNISDFWEPRPDIGRYGVLFSAAAAAIRQADPEATVLTGGLTRGTDTPDRRRISQPTFVEGLYRNGAAREADAIAVHPYSFPALPDGTRSGIVGGFADLPQLHALTRREGDADKKIWVTEFGAPTGTARDAMSDADQRASLLDARRMAGRWEWAGPLVFYELRDSGSDGAELEHNFGVLHRDLSPKESAKALMERNEGAP